MSEQRCAQLEKAGRELERQLSGLSDRLEEEEACSVQLALHRDRLEAECGNLRRDLDKLESALSAAAQAKQVERYCPHHPYTYMSLDPWTINLLQLNLSAQCIHEWG